MSLEHQLGMREVGIPSSKGTAGSVLPLGTGRQMLRCAALLGGAALTTPPCLGLSQQLDTDPGHFHPLQAVRAPHPCVCSH